MKEGVLYHALTKNVPLTRFKRIENRLELGTPDMFFTNMMNRGWLEAKTLILPVNSATKVKIPFRPAQFGWIEEEIKFGGTCVLGIVTEEGYFFSVNRKIQEVYHKYDFEMAMKGELSPLWFVDNNHLEWFFHNIPFVLE